MTVEQLRELENKGKNVFAILDSLTREVETLLRISLHVRKNLELFGSARPCYIIKKSGALGEKLFYFRNVIQNPRQSSPVFVKFFTPEYESLILPALLKRQTRLEEAMGVKITFRKEDKV